MDKYQDKEAFLKGRIHAMKLRLDKAQRRVERADNPVEAERAHRLSKLIWLHENQPEEAILLYDKEKPTLNEAYEHALDQTQVTLHKE